MTRKKRKQQKHTPCFVFTLETITVAQKAMQLFAQSLERVEGQSAKMAFATETMQQVKGKLEAMRTSVGLMCLTTFDYNEKIMLAAAIRLLLFDQMALPLDAQRARELQYCRQIAAYQRVVSEQRRLKDGCLLVSIE